MKTKSQLLNEISHKETELSLLQKGGDAELTHDCQQELNTLRYELQSILDENKTTQESDDDISDTENVNLTDLAEQIKKTDKKRK